MTSGCDVEVASSWAGRVDRSAGANQCWPWTGALMTNGYGQTRIRENGRWRGAGAHQVAYFQATGRWERAAEGRLVRHLCHNRRCCNPSHLVGGTAADNAADRVARVKGQRLLPDLPSIPSWRLPVAGTAWEKDEAGWLVTRFMCASGAPLASIADVVRTTLTDRGTSTFNLTVQGAARRLRVSNADMDILLRRTLATRSIAPCAHHLREIIKLEPQRLAA